MVREQADSRPKGECKTMIRNRCILVLPMLALLLGSFSVGAHAKGSEPKNPTQQSFATVDLDKVFNNYDKKKTADSDLAAYVEGLKIKFQLKDANPLLTADEFNQLSTLSSKAAPTADEKKKIADLTAESNRRIQDFQTLQQKPNASDVEKGQLAKYQAQKNDTEKSLNEENKKAQDDYNTKQADMMKTLLGDIDVAVTSLAKDRGITMVFNKTSATGMPGVILYSGADITDDVLSKLNKK